MNSSFLSFVQLGSERIENCIHESRLSFRRWSQPLTPEHEQLLRQLEVLEPLKSLFTVPQPRLAVEVNFEYPYAFELGRGFVRIGAEWLKDPWQTRRGLTMGLLQREHPQVFANAFQLEVITDFLLITVMGQDNWRGHTLSQDVKLPTSGATFNEYCKSPFVSLAHRELCLSGKPDAMDLQSNVWGFRTLLSVALWRMYDKASLEQKLHTFQTIREGLPLPVISSLRESNLKGIVYWFQQTLEAQWFALSFKTDVLAFKRTLKELEVESSTRWELTVDITHTPVWKEILAQLKTMSRFRLKERTLVFTPEGAVALPSGLPVAWANSDIQSQKHVMIACEWPKPADAVVVLARHVFARQTCVKMDQVFWN